MTERKANLTCPRCGQPTGYYHPQFGAYYCYSMNCCFRWTWEPKKEGPRMRRDWKPASKTVEHPVLTLWPVSLEDHEFVDRILKALDLRDAPDCCIACQGSTLASNGTACIPCRGTGKLPARGHKPLRADGGPSLPLQEGEKSAGPAKSAAPTPTASSPASESKKPAARRLVVKTRPAASPEPTQPVKKTPPKFVVRRKKS